MENDYDNYPEENFLSNIERKNSFDYPEGYFETLSLRLLNRIEFENELEEYKTLATMNRQLKFSIPENYFNNLANILEYKLELSVYSELHKLRKQALSQPPAGYFETLDKNIIEKQEQALELEEFKILSSLKKKNSYTIEPAHFESQEQTAKDKYHQTQQPPSGIIRRISSTIFQPKLAIAASIAVILGTIVFWHISRSDSALQPGDCKTLACLEKHELLNEKNINDFDDENLYEMVDVDELDKNVSEQNTISDSIQKDTEE